MKKIFSTLAIYLLCSAGIMAQSTRLIPALDTNFNSQTQYLSTGLVNGNNGHNVFQYIGTKISGTVSGVVKLQGSLDGVNYTPLGSDSLALADVAVNTRIFDVFQQKRLYYRFVITTTGTVSLQNRGFYVNRKIE